MMSETTIYEEQLNTFESSKFFSEAISKKNKTIELLNMYERNKEKIKVSDNKISQVRQCGAWFKTEADVHFKHYKMVDGVSCKDRFCPRCSAIKAKKEAIKLGTSMTYLKKEFDYAFLFLTLTVQSIDGNELRSEIQRMKKAWRRFSRYTCITDVTHGMLCKLEITYNKQTNQYHPHFHVMIAVDRDYFSTSKYIHQKDFLLMWQDAMDDGGIKVVDVRRVREEATKEEKTFESAVYEMAKYAAKDADYLNNGDDVFCVFYDALKGIRLNSSNGCFKEAFKMFEDGELDEYRPDADVEWYYRIHSIWNKEKNCYENRIEVINHNDYTFEDHAKSADGRYEREKWHSNNAKERMYARMRTKFEYLTGGYGRDLIRNGMDMEIERQKIRTKMMILNNLKEVGLNYDRA